MGQCLGASVENPFWKMFGSHWDALISTFIYDDPESLTSQVSEFLFLYK